MVHLDKDCIDDTQASMQIKQTLMSSAHSPQTLILQTLSTSLVLSNKSQSQITCQVCEKQTSRCHTSTLNKSACHRVHLGSKKISKFCQRLKGLSIQTASLSLTWLERLASQLIADKRCFFNLAMFSKSCVRYEFVILLGTLHRSDKLLYQYKVRYQRQT